MSEKWLCTRMVVYWLCKSSLSVVMCAVFFHVWGNFFMILFILVSRCCFSGKTSIGSLWS